ncbi:MAG TPA: HAD hydrolase family protein [Euzebyales bacterium]|nr:HAD hydrolase family protein [Euzebyales bacterium]
MGITAPIVVVTDLDGTLLDHDTYEPGPAAAMVAVLTDAGVPVVCCSAKTRAEQQLHRRDLGLTGRFVIENGAAVHDDAGPVVVLGLGYEEVRQRLARAAGALGVTLRGFGDMDADEIADRTGLSVEAAACARDRDHTEPFLVIDGHADETALREALGDVDLGLQRGARFWTASGHHDKGAAVGILRELFSVDYGQRPLIYGIGDTHNDTAMLAAADIAMLVQRPDGTWADLDVENLTRIDGIGPSGWTRAADMILTTVNAS